MISTCIQCDKEFKIISQEEAFYAKVNLPLPVRCPECRRARRLSFKNGRKLSKRACATCGAETITTYPPEFPDPVVCTRCFEEGFA